MRAVRRDRRGDNGAVAVLVALLLAFALIPALALGTGSYVRASTGTELQRASDSGALAGAAEIPLGDINFAENYVGAITGSGVVTTLQSLGIQNASNLPDPLVDACKVALTDATNGHNLAESYATYDPSAWCKAQYLPDAGVLGSAQTCVNGITSGLLNGLNLGGLNLGGLVGGLLGGLNLNVLSTSLLADLAPMLPALLRPGIKVTATWHVKAPFDSVFGSDGSTQTSTSIARRLFKNAVVLPNIPLSGNVTVNLNPQLQQTRAEVLGLFQGLEGLLSRIPLLSSCAAVVDELAGDVADAVDPPDNGPSLNTILTNALQAHEPVIVLGTQTIAGLNIPLLDIVPVCVTGLTSTTATLKVQSLTGTASCLVNAPGAFRAGLRNS